jgi:hypothetical protein
LIDPDHCERISRIYDLATALLLFHCDLPLAPKRIKAIAVTATYCPNDLTLANISIKPVSQERVDWIELEIII